MDTKPSHCVPCSVIVPLHFVYAAHLSTSTGVSSSSGSYASVSFGSKLMPADLGALAAKMQNHARMVMLSRMSGVVSKGSETIAGSSIAERRENWQSQPCIILHRWSAGWTLQDRLTMFATGKQIQ